MIVFYLENCNKLNRPINDIEQKGIMKSKLNVKFVAKMQKSTAKGGWTYIVWKESVNFFATKGLVKVSGTIDGQPFQSAFMALGDGTHKLPIKSEIRKALDKDVSDEIVVHLKERLK